MYPFPYWGAVMQAFPYRGAAMYPFPYRGAAMHHSYAGVQQFLWEGGDTPYLLHGLVWLQSNVRHTRVQHEREEVEDEVGRPAVTRAYKHINSIIETRQRNMERQRDRDRHVHGETETPAALPSDLPQTTQQSQVVLCCLERVKGQGIANTSLLWERINGSDHY